MTSSASIPTKPTKQQKVLVQWEQQKSTILEYMKLSAQRLYKVKSGAILVNALDEQGSHVKEQFLKTRRKTETKKTMTESINASDDKIELSERLLQPEHVIDFLKQAQYDKNYGNPDRIKFDFYPELEEKIHQIAINEKPQKPPTEIMEILKQLKLNLPVRPRLKEQTFQEDGGKAVSDINRNLMTRIYGEEHAVATERLDILQKEQKKQAIADLENLENSVVKIKKKKIPAYTPPIPPTALIVKNHFKHNQSLDRAQEAEQNIERARPKKDGVHTILKFRKGIASQYLFPDMKKITSSVDSFKMKAPDNISHTDLAFDVKEVRPRKTEQKENQAQVHEIQRARIKLVSGGTNSTKPPIPMLNLQRRRRTDSSTILRPVDFSARLIQEEVDFLEKERSSYRDKPLFRNSHHINNSNHYKETAHTARVRGSVSKRDSLHSSQISLTISSLRTSGINNLKEVTGGGRKESKDFIKDVWSPPAEKQRGTSFDVTNQREYFHKIVSELEKIVDKNYPPEQNAPRKIKPPLLAKQGKSQSSHQMRRPSVGSTKEVFMPNFGISCKDWKAG